MARGLAGRYFSHYYTTQAGADLLAQVKTSLGIPVTSGLTILKMKLISPSVLTVNINGSPDCDLYLDTDTRYKMELWTDDCQVISLKTTQGVAGVFISIIY